MTDTVKVPDDLKYDAAVTAALSPFLFAKAGAPEGQVSSGLLRDLALASYEVGRRAAGVSGEVPPPAAPPQSQIGSPREGAAPDVTESFLNELRGIVTAIRLAPEPPHELAVNDILKLFNVEKPKLLRMATKEQLLATLRDIIAHIEADDSMEGTIRWEWDVHPTYAFSAFYRTGNSLGQGGSRIVSETTGRRSKGDDA